MSDKGHTSGLKILSYLGKKINRKTSDRRQGLMAQLSSRTPLEHAMDLENELIEIQLLVDELEHQGLRYDAELLYGNLIKSVSVLMNKSRFLLLRLVGSTSAHVSDPDDSHAVWTGEVSLSHGC